jgi:N-acetyl sugar amidotransferase
MKICSNCVIPETAETLSFAKEDGKCTVCTNSDTKKQVNWGERSKTLDRLIEDYKGKYAYDCIVPFSGGKDSTFALWYLVKIKKLRPLVVRFDHNFYRDVIEENTQRTISKLGVDFINYKSNFEIVKKTMLESLIRRGDFCWHCHVGIAAYPVNVAIEKKVPLIFYGEPSAEYSAYYSYEEFEEGDVEHFNKTTNMGINAEDMLEMIKEKYPETNISVHDLKAYIFPTQRELNKNKIKNAYLGNYISWDVRKQVDIIKNELGWKGDNVEGIPQEYNYEKIECMMQGVRDYIKFLKRGFGRTAHLTSIDIRNNRMNREKAVELCEIYDGKKPKSLDLFLKMINITEDEFYEIIQSHIVSPSPVWNKEEMKKKKSNIVPSDFDNWEKKFF